MFDEAAIAAVIDQAAHRLAAVAQSQHITVLIAWPNRVETITPSHSGWCELGRVRFRRPVLAGRAVASGTR
jgi:hypothetical protein